MENKVVYMGFGLEKGDWSEDWATIKTKEITFFYSKNPIY
jgi:hypothetical protein